jgi:hypothetical protein
MKNVSKYSGIIALVSIMGFVLVACGDLGNEEGGGGEKLFIRGQSSYTVTDGIATDIPTSSTSYYWTAYHYTNETNYEEEYTIQSNHGITVSYSDYHYTRTGQTSHSTTETYSRGTVSSGSTSITSTYDLESGFASRAETVSPGGTYHNHLRN